MGKKYFVFDRADSNTEEFDNKTELEGFLSDIMQEGLDGGGLESDLEVDVVMTNNTTFHMLRGMFGMFPGNHFKLALCNSKGYEITESVFFLLEDFFEWADWGVFKTIGKAQYIKSLVKNSISESD